MGVKVKFYSIIFIVYLTLHTSYVPSSQFSDGLGLDFGLCWNHYIDFQVAKSTTCTRLYIIAGILAGPYVKIFPTVVDPGSINIWGEIGVVFLLFALGNIISSSVTLLIMAPFIIALISNKGNYQKLFMKLWNDNRYNKGRLISLVFFRISIAVLFISIVLIQIFDFQYGTVILVSLAVLAIFLFFRQDLNQYARLENQFMINLNQREEEIKQKYPLRASFDNELKNQDIHLTTIIISPNSSYIGKTLQEVAFRQDFGVSIVKITRGNKNINIPDSSEHLYPQDRIVIVGTDDQIKHFMEKMESTIKVTAQESKDIKLELESIIIENHSYLRGKTIENSGIGKIFNCILVGIERENKPIMNPDVTIIFQEGDLIWIVGERENINSLCL